MALFRGTEAPAIMMQNKKKSENQGINLPAFEILKCHSTFQSYRSKCKTQKWSNNLERYWRRPLHAVYPVYSNAYPT